MEYGRQRQSSPQYLPAALTVIPVYFYSFQSNSNVLGSVIVTSQKVRGNLLNGVIGFTDMLLDTDLNDEQIDFAETVKRNGDSLLALINDILDFSKIEAGQLDFEEIDFDPELLAYDACELIRPKIDSKPIEILCHIGDNVPSVVKGDPLRFRQVLVNLMGNAPKFTETGEIELSLFGWITMSISWSSARRKENRRSIEKPANFPSLTKYSISSVILSSL